MNYFVFFSVIVVKLTMSVKKSSVLIVPVSNYDSVFYHY